MACSRHLSRLERSLSFPGYSVLFVVVVSNVILIIIAVWTAASYNVMGVGTVIEKATKNVGFSEDRIRFTQMFSTGHVGTRFLTTLLASPEFLGTNHSTNYFVWNELELPLMRQVDNYDGSKKIWVPFRNASLHDFKAIMSDDESRQNGLGWFGGKIIKDYNVKGDSAALRGYLEQTRIPALRSVYDRYNEPENHPDQKLNHFIKVGHTSIFFNLSDYYNVLSSTSLDGKTTIDVDFVRIRRNRIEVATSFVSDSGRMGPLEYGGTDYGVITNPAMRTALLKFESLGGPLSEEVYRKWTLFQRHLWFCDEVEARWRIFLRENPGVRYYELNYVATEEDPNHQVLTPSSIDDLALNFLGIDHSLSPYMQNIPKHSHVSEISKKESGMTQEAKEEQSIEYSKQAPWCLQYEGTMNDSSGKQNASITEKYPKLDCGLAV